MLFNNYDPGRISASWKGIQLLGFMDGTFISGERSEDAFEMSVGAGGDVTRVRNRNRTGMVTVTLQAASPSNDLLSAQALLDEKFGVGYGPLLVKDLNGNTVLEASVAWIQKVPNVEFADEGSGREWIFACADLVMHVGGSLV
jgi:hypothetical protein